MKPSSARRDAAESSAGRVEIPCRHPVRSGLTRVLLVIAGVAATAIGILGIFLPLLPTTVFLLLAAACFIRSSPSLYSWLMTNRLMGPYLAAAACKTGLPPKAKAMMLLVLWATILYSGFYVLQSGWMRLALIAIACGVSIFVLTRRTRGTGAQVDCAPRTCSS